MKFVGVHGMPQHLPDGEVVATPTPSKTWSKADPHLGGTPQLALTSPCFAIHMNPP